MPVTNVGQVARMAQLSGAAFPEWLAERLDDAADDPRRSAASASSVATELCAATARRRCARPALLHAQSFDGDEGDLGQPRPVRYAADCYRANTLAAMSPEPVRVAVTGAAGQIGYSLLFRIASGAMLGPDQPVILQLLEITPALGALRGRAMELEDCAFPLLAGIVQDRRRRRGVRRRRLRAARRRRCRARQGMERTDLLEANGGIFKPQGKALGASAKPTSRCSSSATRPTPTRSSRMQQREGHRPERSSRP